jgi:hypothetical protein
LISKLQVKLIYETSKEQCFGVSASIDQWA